MTDLELLELAAKAAGYKANFTQPYEIEIDNTWIEWNPLTDDGDALRLAVKLELGIAVHEKCVEVTDGIARDWIEIYGLDPVAATRRAIVQVAAQIGKTL